MWQSTEVSRRLNLKAPIIQGPFGGGLSAVDLTVTVSEAGGLGSFGVHHLSGTQLKDVARNIREKTSQPFALNLWIPYQESDDPPMSGVSTIGRSTFVLFQRIKFGNTQAPRAFFASL